MPLDFPAEAWEPIATLQVPAARAQWMVEVAHALHHGVYYLRVRTYKAGAPAARVRIVGPYSDGTCARAAVQGWVHAVPRGLHGAVLCPAPDAAPGPDGR